MNKSKKIAFSGVFSALCTVLLFLGSIIEVLDLSTAALASLVIMIALIELGKGYAFGVYAAASLLSVIILPNKNAAFVFILFSGVYPILKVYLNNIKPRSLSFFARIGCFWCSLLLLYAITRFFTEVESVTGWMKAAVLLCGTVTFILYDIALERVAVYYIKRIKPLLFSRKY